MRDLYFNLDFLTSGWKENAIQSWYDIGAIYSNYFQEKIKQSTR
jgi:hypothetical protein